MDDNNNSAQAKAGTSDDVWESLKERAGILMSSLEERDYVAANNVIQDLNELRDNTLYKEVGKLTRGLHDAIVNFDLDPGKAGGDAANNESQMANAKDRLDYVINLTQTSADKTMDMVEEGIPIATAQGVAAKQLQADWGRLLRREMDVDEFKLLSERIDGFLVQSIDGNALLGQKFNEILLAQDFQDLTGQVITKVIALVQDVEDRLVELMRVAGQIEELTGIVKDPAAKPNKKKQGLDSGAEGPQIHADTRDDVVSGQDDVDDLLSSLGF
ncbi:protein phosphatase CheZ [Dasania marina]|uniref:protein phosphatase CheZ n=1 Tax=Dasania marina TaxID=471499 RepID=UPI00035FFF01|nr:protein phosphatase CheZ [Dasania marina]